MKIVRIIFSAIILSLSLCTAAPLSAQRNGASGGEIPDSTENSAGGTMSYDDIAFILRTFDGGQPKDVILKAEILINTSKTEKEKIFTADAIYDYYRNSKIMGYDEIAIYFADNYFLNNRFKHPDGDKLLEMKLFSEFNRRSLIGMKGEELILQDPSGRNISTSNGNQDYTILYFYDDQCPNCISVTPALLQFLMRKSDVKYSVYFIYTQDGREQWIDYIKKVISRFTLSENVKFYNLWDPDMSSGFPLKYGVVSTPQLFLLDREGTIIGRGLTPAALSRVVDIYQNKMNRMERIFEQIFVPLASEPDSTAITKEIDTFFEDSKENVPFFHELFYTMFQFLKSSPYYTLQQGAAYLADKYIAGMPEMWESVRFTDTGVTKGSVIRGNYSSPEEFIDEAKLGVAMFYRNMLNKPAADLKLKNVKNKSIRLHKIDAAYTVLYFYSFDCRLCKAVTKKMADLHSRYGEKGVAFAAIYTGSDRIWKEKAGKEGKNWIDLWDPKRKSGMSDKYDLLDVPAIYLLDGKKNVLAKDINPDVLEQLLEYYLENGGE